VEVAGWALLQTGKTLILAVGIGELSLPKIEKMPNEAVRIVIFPLPKSVKTEIAAVKSLEKLLPEFT